MLKWLLARRIAAFERTYAYDMGYARDLLEESPRAFFGLARIATLAGWRVDVPADAWYAAKLAATLAEDCGPCTQLVVRMAEKEGVAPAALRAILTRDFRGMSEDAGLGFGFAEAVLRHDPAADDLREVLTQRWGRRAIACLSLTIALSRVFPTLKYGLGHGRACARVTVGGTPLPVLRRAA